MHALRAPLNHLLKKDIRWKWMDECKKTFEKLKTALTSNLALIYYNSNKQIYVVSDVRYFGLGEVILTKEDGKLKPTQQVSRTLLPAEMNYSQIEKETSAIIFVFNIICMYIHGRKFTLQTDHRPLLAIFGSKNGISTHTVNRLQRWAMMLLNYSFKIELLRSKEIAHVDGLSRSIPKFQNRLRIPSLLH